MGRRLARWRELAPTDRWRLLGLVVALPAIEAMLRIFGAVRTRRWLDRISANARQRSADPGQLRSAEHLAQLAAIAGRRGLIDATCLRPALLLQCLLRRRGLSPEFKLGVRKRDGLFDAHAWVELQGVALGQAGLEHCAFAQRDWNSSTAP